MLPNFLGKGLLTKEMVDAVSREIVKDTGVFTDNTRSSSKKLRERQTRLVRIDFSECQVTKQERYQELNRLLVL